MSSILTNRWWLVALICLTATTETLAQKTPAAGPKSLDPSRPVAAPPHIQKLIDEGDQHHSENNFQMAQEKYLEAHERTKELSDKSSKGSLTVETALKLAQVAAKLPADKIQLDATTKVLEDAGKLATPYQRARIDLGYADVALRQGQPKKAIELMHEADWHQFDKSQQPALKYNLGRAYDLDGQDVEAFRRYGDALKLNPQFSLAADRATNSAWKVIQKDPTRTRAMSLQLTKLGLGNRSAQFALTTLSKPGSERDQDAALALLFQSWAATYPGPTAFVESESFRTFVGRAGKDEKQSARQAVAELVQGGLELNPSEPWKIPPQLKWFEQQSHDVRSACSAFAIAVGKWLIADARKEPQANQAFTRFMIGWGLDRENFNAAIESARVLTLDFPGINPKLVDPIVRRVFEEKEGLYFGKKGLHEWNQLETFHTFLGMIYENRNAWGDPYEVRSAIFQWQHALTAHAAAQKLDPETPGAPGLHEHLAKAWLGREKKDSAFDEYLSAAEGFLKQDDRDTARDLMEQANKLGVTPSPDQQRRVDSLVQQLKAATGPNR